MRSLLLDPATWDLLVDASGNIALASNPYAIAQNVANACRTFQGEVWYNTTLGIPYFKDVLGKRPPFQVVAAYEEAAALTVPEVVQAKATITSFNGRIMTGNVRIVDVNGAEQNVVL